MNFVRIDGFPKYAIHPAGTILKIWKNKTKERKHCKTKDGYIYVRLTNNNGKTKKCYVHRLLALHFIPNDDPEKNIHIDHLDAVRHNNNLNNLEWVSQAENNRRMMLKRPPAEITQGGIRKIKYGSWQWTYRMKTKIKTKQMKSKQDLQKFRKETLIKYNIII
jgi:hypothetical protein